MAPSARDNQKAYLIPYPIESFAKPIPVRHRRTVLGRGHGDDHHIPIDDKHASRKHACIHFEEGKFFIEDLDSQNGTFINNERINTSPLQPHDKIMIGRSTYLFLVHPDAARDVLAGASTVASDTTDISQEDIDFSALWAQKADRARRGFLNQDLVQQTESAQVAKIAHTRLSLLYQLSENLRTISDAAAIYEKGVALLIEAFPAADYALVAKRSSFDGAFKIVAARCGHERQARGDTIPISHTVFDWVLTEEVTLVSENLVEDDRFQESESISINDLRSIVCAPISGNKGPIGLLYAQANNLVSPFNKEDAKFVSAVANEIALNIDNLRFQQEVLRHERMAAIGLTVSNLAHNLKNLLAVNQTAVGLMDSHIKENDYARIGKNWRWIKNSLDDISKLSTDMLEYVKDDDLQRYPVDINKLILANRSLFKQSLPNDSVTLAFSLTDQKTIWVMDEVRFQQALLNLVINAADALKDHSQGRIQISTSLSSDQHLVVSVTDNGCGISDKDKEKVLTLFFSTKGSRGTGLGLAMVQKFVEKSGGRLTFESEEGKGSVFRMVFPKAALHEGTPSNQDCPEQAPSIAPTRP